jgi:hypothetical protein
MAVPTLITAVLMIVVGIYGYTSQDPNAGKVSVTAAMPAFLGAILGVCGLLAFSDKMRKHAMHAAAALALLGAIGSLYPVIKMAATGTAIEWGSPKVVTSLLSSLICAVFVGLCIKSFIDARKARQHPPAP